MLASGELGSHHGLRVSIVVTTTLQELEPAAGIVGTGGGSWLPTPDVIQMASHARHYPRIYDKHTSRDLGGTKRIAGSAQRIVLHAKDRGCVGPGGTAPGYLSEVHHVEDWAAGGQTNIDELTLLRTRQPQSHRRRLGHPQECRRHHRMDPAACATNKDGGLDVR